MPFYAGTVDFGRGRRQEDSLLGRRRKRQPKHCRRRLPCNDTSRQVMWTLSRRG
jgi:hypothetical protein